MRAVNVPLPVVDTADGVSSYPVRISLIFLKPCASATVEADTRAITAIDVPSLRIPFSSKDSVVLMGGAHNITNALPIANFRLPIFSKRKFGNWQSSWACFAFLRLFLYLVASL
jgi:hypothetical protein